MKTILPATHSAGAARNPGLTANSAPRSKSAGASKAPADNLPATDVAGFAKGAGLYGSRPALPYQQRRSGLKRSPFLWPPGFRTYYDIGKRAQGRLPKNHTLREIGRRMGVSHQNAYTESVLALGKLLYRLVQKIGEVPDL